MKKIGIYKPGKTIYFKENKEDHAAWSAEIVDISNLLHEKGHDVFFLSPTDLEITVAPKKLDKIFVFNGVWTSDEEVKTIDKLTKKYTTDINFILTDMRLMTANPQKYRKIFSQSKQLYTYGHLEKHCLLAKQTAKSYTKIVPYYFAGTERGRTKDFFEYVVRPECLWYGKSESLNVKEYIPHHEHLNNLDSAITTIIIADEHYNSCGFVNDRYYECAKRDVICFVDSKCDPDELIIPKDDWCRVSSYIEMRAKRTMLETNIELYKEILYKQRLRIMKIDAANDIYLSIMT